MTRKTAMTDHGEFEWILVDGDGESPALAVILLDDTDVCRDCVAMMVEAVRETMRNDKSFTGGQ